ncbi:hypothetical protein N7381_05835 [Pseudomonas asiatica]|uniref:hypothetical protein n=1 Tax=Pseudomonas asiatica TaxID=2219225 RepID=UPI00244D25C4|nr:hypothetical protein [Pseudomonas asiatica]MDH0132759.1 hypothetical protein [Pseudomonas asiatica]
MVQLTRLGMLNLYAEEVAGEKRRCVFFVPRVVRNVISITLDDALNGGGVLLLTPKTEEFDTIAATGARLLKYVSEHTAIAWYSPADGPAENARRLEVDKSNAIRKFVPGEYIKKALGKIESVDKYLYWSPTADVNKARLEVSGNSIRLLCKAGERPFRCLIDGTSLTLVRKPAASGFEQLAAIHFDATLQSGSWIFSIAPKDALAALRQFDPRISYVFEPEDGFGTLVTERFPVFDLGRDDALKNFAALDLALNAYDTGVSGNYIELQSASATGLNIASNFVTRRGNQVSLKATNARMQFIPNPHTNSFSLAPTGVFDLQAPATGFDARHGIKVIDLLVGGAGTEYITFATSAGSSGLPHAIELVNGCPGFARKLSSGAFELEDRTTTTWVRPSWGEGLSEQRKFFYVVQSEEASLFEAPTTPSAAQLFTAPIGLTFAPKPRLIEAGAGLMPWLPLRNTGRTSAMQFDRTVTGVARRRIASKAQSVFRVQALQAGDWTVTPQGFFVRVDDEGHWQTIRFAKGNEISIELERPPGVTQWLIEEALSRPASFLVATRSPQAAPNQLPELGAFRIGAHGWKLECDFDAVRKAGAKNPSPILIAKFGPGTVIELLKKTEKWSLAADFNDSPDQAQVQALHAVNVLEALSKGESPQGSGANLSKEVRDAYSLMYARLTNPGWNGVILFNASSSVDQLPGDVAALVSGQKSAIGDLRVPTMGVDISRVDQTLTQKPSVFGAVHFFEPSGVDEPKPPQHYALKLRNLDVHIDNSKLRSFVAKADLWTGTLMGDKLQAQSGGDPVVKIEGRLDGKASGDAAPRYVIQALGSQQLVFTGDLLKSLEVTRLEFVSKRSELGEVSARISIRGNLVLGSTLVGFCGVRAVKFDKLALTLIEEKDGTSFGFDAGDISVDWDSDTESVRSWLNSFPLRLSGLRWSGVGGLSQFSSLNWPDIGFTKLDFDPLNLPSFTADNFDFGLEFDLNLGGCGGMTDAAKLLRARILLGWKDFRQGVVDLGKRIGLGFRFEGGSTPLDVGVQGVFRLRAKRVILKTYSNNKLIGFGLDEPRLDILGYEMPKDAKVQLAIVVEAQNMASQPTWLFVSRDFDPSPLEIKYLAIGQNVRLLDSKAPPPSNTHDAVEKSDAWLKFSFKNEDIGELRPTPPRGNKWGLVAKGTLKNIVSFDLAFMDEISLYGIRVDIPDSKPFFTADVLYRKISDDLGIFSVEVDPHVGSIDIGIGSLTLPILGFDRLTNGGGGINLGFNGNDFSKAGTLQAIPFLGSLGMKMGQYTGLSSAFLLAGAPNTLVERYKELKLSPVHEIQLAFRLGFGREIRQSIFRAGVSLTAYGLFQGALAKVNERPLENPIKEYVKIAGAAGVLLEIFGAVDFALISAAVSIRAWVEVGFVVETWQPIELYGEAGVSVYVKFVIARFSVFGRTFEIAVHYSFSTRVRFGQTLGKRLGGNPPTKFLADGLLRAETATRILAEPIDWQAVKLETNRVWRLPLIPSMDLALNDAGAPTVVPLMTVHNPAPHGQPLQASGDSIMDLVVGLLRWAVRLHKSSPGADPNDISYKDLEQLQARLRSTKDAPASKWRANNFTGTPTLPLDVSAIKLFFKENYRFVLMDSTNAKVEVSRLFPAGAPADEDLQAIVFPWLREVEIHAEPKVGGASRPLRVFHDASYEVVTPKWEEDLKSLLKKGRPEYPKDPALLLADDNSIAATPAGKSTLDLMLEDWVGAALESVVGDALTFLAGENVQPVAFKLVLARLVSNEDPVPLALQAAQRASSVLLHGLRVPKLSDASWTSITEFAAMDVKLSSTADGLQNEEDVALKVVTNDWLSGAATLHVEHYAAQQAAALARLVASRTLTLDVALVEMQSNEGDRAILAVVAGPASEPSLLNTTAGTVSRLLPMPGRLQDEVKSLNAPLAVQLARFVPYSKPHSPDPLPGAPGKEAICFAGLFNLRVRKVQTATQLSPGLLEISGAGEQARQILKSWDDNTAIAPDSFRFVVPGAQSAPPSFISQGVQFFTTNLSTEPNPDSLTTLLANGTSPVLADIGDATNMRKFLWMASVVNDTGFFAAIGGTAWTVLEKQLFEKSDVADVSIAWLRRAFDNAGNGFAAPAESLVVVEATSLPDDLALRIMVPTIKDFTSSAPPGFVSLIVSRPYKENDPKNPNDEVELLSRYVFLEHAVTIAGAPGLAFDESPVMAPQPLQGLDVAAPFAAQPADELSYYLSVPLSKFLPAAALATDPVSPYMFVGRNLSSILKFGLRDACGHRFPGNVQPNWKSETVLFRNPLPQIGTLPALKMTWKPFAAGKLRLELDFAPSKEFLEDDSGYQDLKFNLDTKYVELLLEVVLWDSSDKTPEILINPVEPVQGVVYSMLDKILTTRKACNRSLEFTVPASKISTAVKDLPRELSVRLRLRRTQHVDPVASQVNPTVEQTVTVVRPAIPDERRDVWRSFAEEMEAFYPDIFMARMSLGSSGGRIWLGNAKLLEAPFASQYELQSYAPRPLSKQFRSGEAVLLNEDGKETPDAPRKEASDVDLDLLMEQAIELFEEVLTPRIAVKLATHAPAAFAALMESKRSIVQSFKGRLHPVEELSAGIKPEQVNRRFHSLAAKDLRNIYRLGAIAMVRNAKTQVAPSIPRVFGAVAASGADQAVEWSKIRLPMQANSLGVVSAYWKPNVRAESVPFPLSVMPSHVEWPWPNPKDEEYVPSRWLELLSARSLKERQLKLTAGEVPLPLRRLPPTPKLYAHQGTAAVGVLNAISDVRRWIYQLDVAVPAALQDTVEINLDYMPQAAVAIRSDVRTLFDALVGFTHHRERLAGYLSELKKPNTAAARIAVLGSVFHGFFADLARTLYAHEPNLPLATQQPETDRLIVDIEAPTGSDVTLTYSLSPAGPRKASLELALLEAATSPFLPLANPIIGKGTTIYRTNHDVEIATSGIASLSGRRATVTGLDILKQPVVMPAIKAYRNQKLGNVRVDKEFILATQETRTSEPLVVHLVQPSGRFQISKVPKTLAKHLEDFATELFGSDAAQVTIDAHCALVYPWDKSRKQVFRSPLGVLKCCQPVVGRFTDAFAQWGAELATAIGTEVVDPETPPQGLELSVTVYANYAGDLPVLDLPRLWIDWRHINQSLPLFGSMPERVFNDRGLLESLYWLTGGWRPDSPTDKQKVRKLREKVARLLRSVPCYNNLPDHSDLPLRELDALGMYAAWNECADVLKTIAKNKRRPRGRLSWFLAPLDPTRSEEETIRKLMEGPFWPKGDCEVKVRSPVNSVWRATDDPFSGRSVVLVEVLEKHADTAAGPA